MLASASLETVGVCSATHVEMSRECKCMGQDLMRDVNRDATHAGIIQEPWLTVYDRVGGGIRLVYNHHTLAGVPSQVYLRLRLYSCRRL